MLLASASACSPSISFQTKVTTTSNPKPQPKMSPSQLRARAMSATRARLRARLVARAANHAASSSEGEDATNHRADADPGSPGAVPTTAAHEPEQNQLDRGNPSAQSDDDAYSDAYSDSDGVEDQRVERDRPAGSVRRSGRTKIYVNGYEYTRSNVSLVKIAYRCSFYRSQECPAKLSFYAATMEYDFANAIGHTCVPPARVQAVSDRTTAVWVTIEMKRDVDALAVSGSQTPQQIWDSVSARFYNREDGAVVRGLSKNQVIRRVHRTRALHYGADLHGRVEVPPLSRVLNTSINFFQFHHVWTSSKPLNDTHLDRVIGWAHPALVTLLRYQGITLFIDGTFRCVPGRFKQCIVVMVYDRGTKLHVPVFYVLAGSKTYECYWNVLQYINDVCGDKMAPQDVVCDFESALLRAVGDWFPEAKIMGCLFHFKQACQRKMGKYHIPVAERSVAMESGVLDMLTIVEQDKIAVQGIAWVEAKIEERCDELGIPYSVRRWERFWAYFRRTWVRLLPPKFWNVNGISRTIVARTNNPLERFNRELNAAFATPHPSVPRFVQTIEEMSRRYVRLRDEINRGVATAPPRETRYNLPTPVELPDLPANEFEEASEGSVSDSASYSDTNDSDADDDVTI